MRDTMLTIIFCAACLAAASPSGAEKPAPAQDQNSTGDSQKPAWYDTPTEDSNKKAEPATPEQAFAREKGVRPIVNGGWIKTLVKGSGAIPRVADSVKVNYRGSLTDGTEFDSSYKRGQPAIFPLKAVIPCWTNGVSMMKVGEKAKLICPPDTAYGERGHPPVIPGGATLIFEIELLDIVRPKYL